MRPVAQLVLLAATVALPAVSQTPMRLKPANATLSADFTMVTSVRELSDGRVIIGDGRDQTLWVADFTADRHEPLGRKGRGPGEYSFVGWVRPIGADSSIMTDLLQRRWMLFDGARIVASTPPDHPAVVKTEGLFTFADRLGHVLFVRPTPSKAGVSEVTPQDSSAVELVSRVNGQIDTVAMLRPLPRRRTVEYGPNGTIKSSRSELIDRWAREENAILSTDGSLAAVRIEPLRIDWRSPDGTWTRGAPLPVKPLRLDQREKDGINARRAAASAQNRNAANAIPAPAIGPLTDFPPFLPIQANEPVTLLSATGQILIHRSTSMALPGNRYLVVSRKGTLDGELVLGDKSTVIGFGAKSMYVVTRDDDDVQHISRHPWP